MEPFWGHFGGHLGVFLGLPFRTPFWTLSGPLWGPSWPPLGAHLGPSWAPFGVILGSLLGSFLGSVFQGRFGPLLEPSWGPFWGRFGLILGPLGGPFFNRFVDIFEKGENSKNRRQYCIFGLFLAFPGASRRPFWAPFRHNFCAFFDVLFLKRFGAISEPILEPFWGPSWGHFGGQVGVILACYSILGKTSRKGAKNRASRGLREFATLLGCDTNASVNWPWGGVRGRGLRSVSKLLSLSRSK